MKTVRILSAVVTALWLAACTHTVPTPPAESQKAESQKAESQKEDTRQKTEESPSAAPEGSTSSGRETEKNASLGPENAPATTVAAQPQTGATPPGGKTISVEAAQPNSQRTAENPGARESNSREAADAKLDAARENLRISEATAARIASELEQLKKSGKASPQTIKDYETYLESVRQMATENGKMVAQMEAAQSRYHSAAGSNAAPADKLDRMLDPAIPEEEPGDRVAELDRQLNASLAKFDDMLLKEMDAIQAGSAKKMQDLAEQAADAAKRLREKGMGSESSPATQEESAKADEAATANKGAPQKDTQTASKESQTGSETTSGDASRSGGEGASRKDQGSPAYEDDDIVARQLREAAENETDPELKKKLWKEYEEYKQNRR